MTLPKTTLWGLFFCVNIILLAGFAAEAGATGLPVTSGLILQLDGSSASAGATFTWADLSSGGNDATQSDSAKQPLLIPGGLNGLDTVRFDGSNDLLYSPGLLIDADTTVFFVSSNTVQTSGGSIHRAIMASAGNPYQASGTGYGFGHFRTDVTVTPSFNISLGDGASTEQKFTRPTTMDNQFRVWSFTRDGSDTNTAELYENGYQLGTAFTFSRTTGFTAGYNIGNDPSYAGRAYMGDVAEILVYDRQLTPEEHNAVGVYLEQKYGVYGDFVNTEQGLQAYWNFDDGTATDQVGSHDGIAFQAGAVTNGSDVPAAGGAQSLDLTHGNDYVTLPSDEYGIVDEYTISAWIKKSGDGRFFAINRDLTTINTDRSGVSLGVSGGKLFSGVISSGPNNANNTGATYHDMTATDLTIPNEEWVHVAATLKDDKITMYLNGVAATAYAGDNGSGTGTLKVLGTDLDFIDNDGSFSGFGADGRAVSPPPGDADDGPDYTTSYFPGLIDEVAVWNIALSPAAIQQLAAGASPLAVPEPSTLALLVLGGFSLAIFSRPRWRRPR